MKINELERILNISRANIRFYEKEGLLNPERKENGYREYDESEVALLKKIIIYRKLGISIQSIKEIFDGKLSLSDAINTSISSINSEFTELAFSAKLCREIKNKNIDNSTLNEEYYWNEMNRIESMGEDFYDFSGMDINKFEKGRKSMKYKITLGITSVALLIFTLVVAFSRYGLILAEYGGLVGVSQLHYLPVIQALFPVCAVLTVIFIIAFIIVLKKDVKNGKSFCALFISSIVVSVVIIGATISVSYKTAIFDERYADITLSDEEAIKIDSEYKKFFPYYDDFYEYVGTEFNYSYSRCEIPQAVHIHIQNFSWYEEDALYDVEYFESDDNNLLDQYNLQKTVPEIFVDDKALYPEGITKNIDDIEYLIYQNDEYFEIRIINNKSYYSIVFMNFSEMLELDETEFTEIAVQQYELMKSDAQNSRGESRSLSEVF